MSYITDSDEYQDEPSEFYTDEDFESSPSTIPHSTTALNEIPSVEEQPTPLSKNNGSRFMAFMFDQACSHRYRSKEPTDVNVLELHENRISLTEEHVMFCRKANLYNETFNVDSMADVLWSHQILSSDTKRTIGHALCIDSTTVCHARSMLEKDPIIQHLTNGDVSNIPFYRWRHLRDCSFRQDDGRYGLPMCLIAMDRRTRTNDDAGPNNVVVRNQTYNHHLEYLIRSERVIASGALHLATNDKDDPASIAVGELTLFNAPSRQSAIQFCEQDPYALAGLYDTMKVHRYNNLDVTGKFNQEDILRKDESTADMKDAMEIWGYPVHDSQTKWINC